MPEKITITDWAIFGDSLTDRGEMANRRLFGLIPMRFLSGLAGKSPLNRFTNRFTWADHFFNLIIQRLKQKEKEIADNNDDENLSLAESPDFKALTRPKLKKITHNSDDIQEDERMIKSHEFDNYRYIEYQGHKDFVRCYAEGGLSSYNYRGSLSKSISRFFARLILSNLGDMRSRLLHWDKTHDISKKQKSQTLVIEWSGANDFVTVNEKPSVLEARRAVKARIKNVKKLIKKGYCNFVLFNLPDLSLTPRFQNTKITTDEERKNATRCTEIFNEELANAQQELLKIYPHCSIDIFDVNTHFQQAFKEPEKYGFDADKVTKNFCDATNFEDNVDDVEADKYMFWNDIHPSDRMHRLLSVALKKEIQKKYDFQSPDELKSTLPEKPIEISVEKLLASFQKKYEARLLKDKKFPFFGRCRRSKIDYKTATLDTILQHALQNKRSRTFEVIQDLQWVNSKGELNLNIPILQTVLKKINNATSVNNENTPLLASVN